ncbi:MAG: hypothetical protein HOQ21_09890 [Dermatophilaceae bacterium]|nr:hypothetical protein [Dermatophilaceae bacterium]
MATAKVMIILLMLAVVMTTSTVLTSTLARPSDAAEVVASLLRLATAVSWVVLAVFWVGNRIMARLEEVRTEALGHIAGLAARWGDHLLAAELDARLSRAEEGSSSSLAWLQDKRTK